MSGENFSDSESVTWQSHRRGECPPDLRFLHYNDVYHIEYVASDLFIKYAATQFVLIQF